MNHPYELQQELEKIDSAFIALMQTRLNWCVETERYETAARLRDLITYETTDDEEFKQQYYFELVKKYEPEFYEVLVNKKSKKKWQSIVQQNYLMGTQLVSVNGEQKIRIVNSYMDTQYLLEYGSKAS